MQLLTDIIKFIVGTIGQVALAILGIVVLVGLGGVMIGLGAVYQMQWLVYAGVVVAALGIIPIVRVFSDGN